MAESRLKTTSEIAEILDEPFYRIRYVLQTRRHIKPVQRSERLKLYDGDAFRQITIEIEKLNQRRGAVVV